MIEGGDLEVTVTLPRRDEVRPGTVVLTLSESATTITSASRISWCAARKASKDREPASSSPSTKIAMPTPRSSPRASIAAVTAATCVITPALSSDAPAPVQPVARQRRLERRRVPQLGAAGGLHVVVGVEEHRGASRGGGAARHDRG